MVIAALNGTRGVTENVANIAKLLVALGGMRSDRRVRLPIGHAYPISNTNRCQSRTTEAATLIHSVAAIARIAQTSGYSVDYSMARDGLSNGKKPATSSNS